jgi:thiamine-phosphate pyrophosphorylase
MKGSFVSDRGRDYLGLHVLVDDDPRWGRDPVDQARIACAAGVPVIQLRAKNATDRQCLEWAKTIRKLTREVGARFVMNDRYDIALLADADAVHLGQTDLPPSAIPEEVRLRLAIGRSTHTEEELETARSENIDYVAFGPVFGTSSKESEFDARGLEALTRATRLASPRPLIAIGGIQLTHLPDLRRAGVGGFAVISAVAGSPDPTAAARDFLSKFAEEPA